MKTDQILEISGLRKRQLARIDAVLPIESQSRERSRRLWTTGDSVAILVAADLMAQGMEEEVALRLVATASPAFTSIVADVRQVFAVAIPDDSCSDGVRIMVGSDKDELINAILDRPQAAIVDISARVKSALIRLLEAKRQERAA